MSDAPDDATWPPGPARAELLDRLAVLIERGGAAHLLDALVVAADEQDFPGPWVPTWAACESLVLRMLWHAHVDLAVALEDKRPVGTSPHRPRTTKLAWVANADHVATFELRALGRDDLTAIVAIEVGRAFSAWIANAGPYREGGGLEVTARDGAIAAAYLGLGVLVTQAAARDGGADGAPARSRQARAGLSWDDACYLLAVQAVARGVGSAAHASLPVHVQGRLCDLIAGLEPHRAALLARLGIDPDAPREALVRAWAPAVITEDERPDPWSPFRHRGRSTFRVRRPAPIDREVGAFFGAGTAGAIGGIVFHLAPVLPLTVGLAAAASVVAALTRRRPTTDGCARCDEDLPPHATTCPGCGATVAGRARSVAEAKMRFEA